MALTAFSLNRVELIGNLGGDCETRFTTNNVDVTNFNLATTHGYKGPDGNWKNETTWHRVVAFKLNDFTKENLKKGKKFYVEGRIQKRDYTDKEGIKRYMVEVLAEKIIPVDSTISAGSSNYSSSDESSGGEEPDMQVDENEDLPF